MSDVHDIDCTRRPLDSMSAEPKNEPDSNKKKSQATRFVELADCVELGHCDEEGYVVLHIDGHRETWKLRSKRARDYLTHRYYLSEQTVPSSQAVEEGLRILNVMALYDGHPITVHQRVAAHDGAIYIDLCDAHWRAIKVTTTGWHIIANPPVRFVRWRGMQALPEPAAGDVDDLWSWINVTDPDDRRLILGWLLQAMRPTGPYPVLILQGPQGCAKSSCARVLRSLIDPSAVMLRTTPKDERDLMIAARNSWMISLDNLSGLTTWLSDAICRLATGGGMSTRELYSDTDEVLIDVRRPQIANGIDDIASRQDLIDRSVIINLQPIPGNQQATEIKFWSAFEAARPALLGGLLEVISRALANLPTTDIEQLPRMADFAIWATAAEPVAEEGKFIQAYRKNRKQAVEAGLEGSPVATALRALMEDREYWSGTATELLAELEAYAEGASLKLKSWPGNAKGLSSQLTRLAVALRSVGIEIHRDKTGRAGRQIRVLGKFASPQSTSSPPQKNQGVAGGAKSSWGRTGDANGKGVSHCFNSKCDADDAKDANFHAHFYYCPACHGERCPHCHLRDRGSV